MIASLGGAEVNSKGARNYAGSGGMVGGLSPKGANWSYWTGAGLGYNRFTPNDTSGLLDRYDAEYPTGGESFPQLPSYPTSGNTGGTSLPSTTNVPIGSTSGLPSWIQGSYSGNAPFNGSTVGIGLSFLPNGLFTANFSGSGGSATQQGYIYEDKGVWYLRLGDEISRLIQTTFGFITQSTRDGEQISYYGYTQPTAPPVINCFQDCDAPTQIPIENPTAGGNVLGSLMSLLQPSGRTSVNTNPLYSFNPNQSGSASGSGIGGNMNILLLVGLIVAGYFVYKKYWK